MTSTKYNVLILGASYGSLLGTKLLLAGHPVTLVCTSSTAELINSEGTLVRLPVRGRDAPVEIFSRDIGTELKAATPESVDPGEYDLIVFAMQEPQYGSAGVRELMDRIGEARVPCMAIMNMPPLCYLERIPSLSGKDLSHCYTDPGVWGKFDPALVTLASPDPQAFRPPEEGKNVLQVGLPTNFKVSRFDNDENTAMLRQLQAEIEAIRYQIDGDSIELPVKLKVHDSIFVPLAKWLMLLTGNYRCIQSDKMISIKDAVHSDIEQSRQIYDWVGDLCMKLGAAKEDLVPFEKYANAATNLLKPSSAARATFAGAKNIERVDYLVQQIGRQLDMHNERIDSIVATVDQHLNSNRQAA
jgi:hypothetical protein